jgi:uncharacterized protein YndB with AHSA1/START domain
MWSCEHTAEAGVPPETIWRLWADVEHWGDWNSDIESIEIDGPFEVGSIIAMTTGEGDTVALRIAEVRPDELFVDEADVGGAVIRTTHRIERLGEDRIRIVYRTEITGPAADDLGPEIGPAITGDFPETIAALVALAQG